jgi:hypothetical protein
VTISDIPTTSTPNCAGSICTTCATVSGGGVVGGVVGSAVVGGVVGSAVVGGVVGSAVVGGVVGSAVVGGVVGGGAVMKLNSATPTTFPDATADAFSRKWLAAPAAATVKTFVSPVLHD